MEDPILEKTINMVKPKKCPKCQGEDLVVTKVDTDTRYFLCECRSCKYYEWIRYPRLPES